MAEDEKSIDKDEEKILRGFKCYHGFLPREELTTLLKEEGDYLMRLSEVDQPKPAADSLMQPVNAKPNREIVVSVKAQHLEGTNTESCMSAPAPLSVMSEVKDVVETKPEKLVRVKNLIIKRVNGKYQLEQSRSFDGIWELVEYYHKHEGTINRTTFQLKQPIGQQSWEFMHSDVKLGKLLGQGAFGEVRQGTLFIKGGKNVDVAVKLTKGVGDLCKAKIKEMMKEARIMRHFKHVNVVRLHGVAVHEQPLYIILELVQGGGLDGYLKEHAGKISTTEKMAMSMGAALGVEYLHSKKCIHMDLAARNCLYTVEKIIKISDFGLSRYGKATYALKPGAPCKFPIKWLAPETLETLSFSTKTDVFSYGNILYEIFADGKEPWDGHLNAEVKKNLVEGKFLEMPSECPDKLRRFVRDNIFVRDVDRRATMVEIVAYFRDLGIKAEGHSDEVKADEKRSIRRDVTEKQREQSMKSGKRKKRKGFHLRHRDGDGSSRH